MGDKKKKKEEEGSLWSKIGSALTPESMRKTLGQDEPFQRGEGDEGYNRMKKEFAKREALKKQREADKKKYGYEDGGVKDCSEKSKKSEKFEKLKKLLRSKK